MLKKLSLAALVAMGSMSVASATDLSSAIQGVDLKGYLRLRAYHESDVGQKTRWRTTAAFNFTVPVSDELKFHSDFAFDWNMYADASTKGSNTPGNTHMFLDYAKNGLNVLVGKIPVVTPVTGSGVGEALGAGVLATYKVNDMITLAAAGLDTLANTDVLNALGNQGKNTYAAAAIINNEYANAQVWFFKVDDTIDSDIVISADVKNVPVVKVHFDYATAKLDDSISKDTQTYFNLNAKYSEGQVCAKLGYAMTGKDGGTVVLDGDSPIASVFATEQITGIANTDDNNAIYAKLGYNVDDKTNVYAAYTTTDKSGDEYLVGAKYKYTKKFNVGVYYSILSAGDKYNTTDNNEARAEFKYSF